MMERLFQHPGWLKLFSVAVAIMLWAYVMPSYTAETQRSFEVPLTVIHNPNPNYDILEDLPTSVQIRAEGKNFVMSRLKKENFRAYLDLSKVTEIGTPVQLQVEVQTQGNYKSQFDWTVTPKSFQVTLVEQTSVTRPLVVADPTGIVTWNDWEYQYTARLDADEVTFDGRSDYLALVKQGFITVAGPDLTPDESSLMREVTPLDVAGRPVKIATPKLPVHLEWVKLPPGRSFRVQVQTIGLLPPGLTVTSVEVDPQLVLVRAASLDGQLPANAVIQTEPLDLTGRTESFVISLKLQPPPGTIAAADSVAVKVNIGDQVVEQVYKGIPLTARGASDAAQVSLAVTDVQVRLQGAYSSLKTLEPTDISAYVDLEGIQAGKHILPVKVGFPPGVSKAFVDPATVEVTIAVP